MFHLIIFISFLIILHLVLHTIQAQAAEAPALRIAMYQAGQVYATRPAMLQQGKLLGAKGIATVADQSLLVAHTRLGASRNRS